MRRLCLRDEMDEAQKLFVEDLTSTLQIIALDATPALAGGAREIQVDFNPDVVAYYILTGYENRDICWRLWLCHSLDFRNGGGEIGVGHSATILYLFRKIDHSSYLWENDIRT